MMASAAACGTVSAAPPVDAPTSGQKAAVHLPNEMLLKIFSYLTAPDLGKCSLVCRRWCQILRREENLWKCRNSRIYFGLDNIWMLMAVAHAMPELEAVVIVCSGGYRARVAWPFLYLDIPFNWQPPRHIFSSRAVVVYQPQYINSLHFLSWFDPRALKSVHLSKHWRHSDCIIKNCCYIINRASAKAAGRHPLCKHYPLCGMESNGHFNRVASFNVRKLQYLSRDEDLPWRDQNPGCSRKVYSYELLTVCTSSVEEEVLHSLCGYGRVRKLVLAWGFRQLSCLDWCRELEELHILSHFKLLSRRELTNIGSLTKLRVLRVVLASDLATDTYFRKLKFSNRYSKLSKYRPENLL